MAVHERPVPAHGPVAGRLDRRFSATAVVATGCLVAAVGAFVFSSAGTATPFVLIASGYVLFGAGFGTFVPVTTHLAMRDVPAGVSGAASGVLNASRQIGTSVGLAVLGAIGVHAAVSDQHAAAQAFAHGYHLAVGVGAACFLAAAGLAVIGFRRPLPAPSPGRR